MSAIVEVEGLTKSYRKRASKEVVTAADGISFRVDEGEILGLLGPNGAGKTTTIKMICSLLRPDAGRVLVRGIDTQRHRLRALRHLSAVLEGNRNLYWRLSVRENMLYFAGNRGVSARMVGTVLVNLIIIVLMLFLSMATARQWLNLDLLTLLPILLLTITGMLGVGFMVAGLSLVYKQVDSLLQIAQFVFLALVAVPLSALPLLELAPVVKGADMVRGVMVEGTPLTGFFVLDWLSLGLNAAAYFLLGIFLYGRAERRAMNRGLLGQY